MADTPSPRFELCEPLDCTPVPPGEIECCDQCAGPRQRGARMTPLGWTTFHNAHKQKS